MVYDPEYQKKYREKNREKKKEYNEKNKENFKEQDRKRQEIRREYLKRHAFDSITAGSIIVQHKWDLWCNQIKCVATTRKRPCPYSDDFTNDIMFKMMLQGCFYCGDIATTIDRIDSNIDHTVANCIGCCLGCNKSKGVSDPYTFIKKAYYRVRGEYHDEDTDIWFVHKNKPSMCDYKRHSEKKGTPFELTIEDWESLIAGKCEYCKRDPTTWFGVDRVVPSEGYVLDNVVSCCFDCNLDKLEDDIETMSARNERIAKRVDDGELTIAECDKVILRHGGKSGKKHRKH